MSFSYGSNEIRHWKGRERGIWQTNGRPRMPRVLGEALVAVLLLQASLPAFAAKWQTVFVVDANGNPSVASEVIRGLPTQGRAILALYAMELGAGCTQPNHDGLPCALTMALGIGPQCSPAHLQLVRTWFRGTRIPNMGGYADKLYADGGAEGALEKICDRTPYTATRQRVWDKIKIKLEGNTLSVDAFGGWLVADQSGKFRYKTTYTFTDTSVSILSHAEVPTESR
jgi:hypothetical protein